MTSQSSPSTQALLQVNLNKRINIFCPGRSEINSSKSPCASHDVVVIQKFLTISKNSWQKAGKEFVEGKQNDPLQTEFPGGNSVLCRGTLSCPRK